MYQKTEQEIMRNWKGDIDKPVVSVCCTTYNHESYIAEAIDGFLMQETDFPFEILIRDDCSTDKTVEIVKQYADQYPKLIKPVFEKENTFSKGVKPMLQLYKIAKGIYIAICEGDDYWTDSLKLQKQVDFLEANPEYVITYHNSQPFDKEGKLSMDFGGAKRDLEPYELRQATPIYTLTVCFRNVITHYPNEVNFSKIGDLFLWALLAEYGKGKFIGEIEPSMYRVHGGGIYSQIKNEEKRYMRFTLNSALLSYHHRMGNEEAETYFKKLIFQSYLSSLNTKFIFFESLKILKRKLFLNYINWGRRD